MFRLAANLSFLFAEREFSERFAAAAAAGFRGVECLFPYDWPADRLRRELRTHDLEMVLFNLPPGDWAAGERGIASHPGREAEFREGLERALSYARDLGCRRLHCLAGLRLDGPGEAEQRDCYLANLREAGAACAAAGVTLLIEPINSRVDMPGYWLDTPAKALDCLRLAGAENLALQFDVYHAQLMTGDAVSALRQCRTRVGHVQVADCPGRHEPGSGEIDWPGVRAALTGYAGWIGCEYRPQADTVAGLNWRKAWD
jgi:hydroxypyruvate isomerase